jgi:hypothetical protein
MDAWWFLLGCAFTGVEGLGEGEVQDKFAAAKPRHDKRNARKPPAAREKIQVERNSRSPSQKIPGATFPSLAWPLCTTWPLNNRARDTHASNNQE